MVRCIYVFQIGKGIDVYEHGVKKAYEFMVNKERDRLPDLLQFSSMGIYKFLHSQIQK